MKRIIYKLSIVLGLVLLLGNVQSCYYDVETVLYHQAPVNCTTLSAKFATDVQPIINLHCATNNCHNSTGAGNTVLQNYDQVVGKLDRIRQRVLIDKTMPPNGSLTPSQLDILKCWMDGGALNN